MFAQRRMWTAGCLSAWVFTAAVMAVDTDGDGVDDTLDVCCATPASQVVDAEGRPLGDLDGDCDVDLDDFALFQVILDANLDDFALLQANLLGAAQDGPCCASALDTLDDGTGIPAGGVPDIVFSEIKPGEYIEVYNSTGQAIDLSLVGYVWCAPFQYWPVATNVTVPANGYATLAWPNFISNPTENNGEMILYKNSNFITSANILDFVCWGSSLFSRKGQAESVGKWSGLCAPSIPAGGAIHRIIGSTGTTSSSYQVSAQTSPQNCAP